MTLHWIDSFLKLQKLLNFPTEIKDEHSLYALKKNLVRRKINKKKWWIRIIYDGKDNNAYSQITDCLRNNIQLMYKENADWLDCVFGYVKWWSIVNNARKHLKSVILINIDINNFFDSIRKNDVKHTFKKYGVHEKIADILSEFMTIDDKLITWSSCSPILSNLLFIEIDKEINNILNNWWLNLRYSRYADDLTFSSLRKVDYKDLWSFLCLLKSILLKYGFKINEKKTRIYTRKIAQYVTWLTVNDDDHPRLPKKVKRTFRLESYYIEKYWIESHCECSGNLFFAKMWDISYSGWKDRVFWIEWKVYESAIQRMINKLTK